MVVDSLEGVFRTLSGAAKKANLALQVSLELGTGQFPVPQHSGVFRQKSDLFGPPQGNQKLALHACLKSVRN